MKKFVVTITEFRVKSIEVDAENEAEAYDKVHSDYLDDKVELTTGDIDDVLYDTVEVTEAE